MRFLNGYLKLVLCLAKAESKQEQAPIAPIVPGTYYVCERESCGQMFTDRDSIRDHIRSHYGLQPLGRTPNPLDEFMKELPVEPLVRNTRTFHLIKE